MRRRCSIFSRQIELIDEGMAAEAAFKVALAQYNATRKREEARLRLAEQAHQESLAVGAPASSPFVEEAVREERDAIDALTGEAAGKGC